MVNCIKQFWWKRQLPFLYRCGISLQARRTRVRLSHLRPPVFCFNAIPYVSRVPLEFYMCSDIACAVILQTDFSIKMLPLLIWYTLTWTVLFVRVIPTVISAVTSMWNVLRITNKLLHIDQNKESPHHLVDMCSVISAFIVTGYRMIYRYYQRPWSDCSNAHNDLGLCSV